MATRRLTERDIDEQILAAKARTTRALHLEPRAESIRYSSRRRELLLSLTNGVVLNMPVALVPGLEHATRTALSDIRIIPGGFDVRWESLDVDLGVSQLVVLALGRTLVSRAGGTVAGARTSRAKATAARRNGAKGGRPRTRK
ncbi:MAG TPA: DUF2442 domain-containing protein [Gemmatimonadales bacterium]|nr:DUF2442 domain-containing protein [Gemmatimonadales bacterium]